MVIGMLVATEPRLGRPDTCFDFFVPGPTWVFGGGVGTWSSSYVVLYRDLCAILW